MSITISITKSSFFPFACVVERFFHDYFFVSDNSINTNYREEIKKIFILLSIRVRTEERVTPPISSSSSSSILFRFRFSCVRFLLRRSNRVFRRIEKIARKRERERRWRKNCELILRLIFHFRFVRTFDLSFCLPFFN